MLLGTNHRPQQGEKMKFISNLQVESFAGQLQICGLHTYSICDVWIQRAMYFHSAGQHWMWLHFEL